MRTVFALLALGCLLFFLPVAVAQTEIAPTNDTALIAAKAKDLIAGKESRVDKFVALHAFVRDEIAQAKTQYG